MKIQLDHIYVTVENMDRAVTFYEDLLGKKVAHREDNRWADFEIDGRCYFGLINPKIVAKERIIGNNSIPVFWTDDVDEAFEKVKKWKCRIDFEPKNLDFTDYPYRCFAFYDTEGNMVEVANYEKALSD